MRAALIEFLSKTIETPLLFTRVGRRRRRGRRLQRAVHPLVTAILCRFSWRDPLQPAPGFKPFHRNPAEPSDPARSEGRTVVGADRLRHSVLLKDPLEHRIDLAAG